jgi:hypothetical protein
MIVLLMVLEILGAMRSLRAVGGRLPIDSGIESVEWIRADARAEFPPKCFVFQRKWSCWAASTEPAGIVVSYAGTTLWWRPSDRDTSVDLQLTRWGRLVMITNTALPLESLRVVFARAVAPAAGRSRAMRLGTAAIRDASATAIAPGALWIVGDSNPPDSWIEIASDVTAPLYLSLSEVAEGPVSLPLHVTLPEARAITGRVFGSQDQPASGALATVFRLIDPLPADARRGPPRRVLAAESVADDAGRFMLPALGEANYELMAWHAQLGRASIALRADSDDLIVRLRGSGIVRGRVIAAGRPVAGVDVVSVPDAAAFSAAEDMTVVKGGDTKTGADGRFSVTVAPSGGGELRIGGGIHPVKRIPLPRAPVPLFDAGDIDLGAPIIVTIVLDSDIGCPVRAAGPVGRTGLQIVSGTRTGSRTFDVAIPEPGLWEFTLACGRDSRSLSPSAVQVGPAQSRKEVRMAVR